MANNPKTIFVAGATGFVGTALCAALIKKQYALKILTRDPAHVPAGLAKHAEVITGNPQHAGPWMKQINGCHAVVNLVGESLFTKKWDASHKQAIYDSRVISTRNLANGIGESIAKPEVFVSASGIAYYGTSLDQEFDERTAHGQDYLANLTKDWEGAAYPVLSRHVRLVTLRAGVVLHPKGGALARMLPFFRWGLGGPLGNGDQWFSWIHRRDLIRMLVVAIEQPSVVGPINGTAPEPVRQKDFARTLARVLQRPCLIPTPAIALKLLMGEGANVVLTGQKVMPDAIRSAGFKFHYPQLEEALAHLLRRR